MRNKVTIYVHSEFFLIFTLALFLIPVRWVLGWIIAGFLHEFSHMGMLYIQKVKIVSVSIKASGAIIMSEPMSFLQEFYCALAGPLGSLSSYIFLRIFPEITICAFLQSAFNLLPAYPLDGGRAIKCAVSHFWGESRGEAVSKYLTGIVFAVLSAISFWLIFYLHIHLLLPVGFLLLNMMKNSLQSRQNDSTILSFLERT